MKQLLYTTLFAACTAFGFSSCNNGDYDATPLTNTGATNPLNTSGSGSGGSGSSGISGNYNQASFYTWTGTDPLSMKIDGTAYQATGIVSATSVGGFITATLSGNGKTVTVNMADNVSTGNILTLSSTSAENISLQDGGQTYYSALGSGGAIYIVDKTANNVKGKFVANAKVLSGSESKNLTEGWFNINY